MTSLLSKFKVANVYSITLAFLASLAWLLPNHFPPWASFHADAWMAAVGILGTLAILVSVKGPVAWNTLSLVVLGLICVPWVQFAAGLLTFASQAWLSSTYLLGFLLALLVGSRSEAAAPNQLANALFGAISLAALASVGLALGSWAEVIDTDVNSLMSMGYYGGRHYANLGQPNLLATLLIWGLLGCLWAYARNVISPIGAVIVCIYLVIGLTLTRSRMAYVAGITVLLTIWIYRKFWLSSRLPLVATLVFIAFLLSPNVLQIFDTYIFADTQYGSYARPIEQGELRLSAWRLFLHAILERPWFGYGWTEVVKAQIEVAEKFPSLNGMFGHSHNLLLDLILWTGIPLGAFTFGVLVHWFLQVATRIKCQQEVVLLLAVLTIGIHSMLEYPYQYAYFLIPIGLIMGILSEKVSIRKRSQSSAWILVLLWSIAVAVFGIIVHDYLNIQDSYNLWRFERAGIKYSIKEAPKIPNTIILTQYKYWLEMAYSRPHKGMSKSELLKREEITQAYPSPGAIYELANAFALNDNENKARHWLGKICPLATENECALLRATWESRKNLNPSTANIDWPHSR